MPDRAQKCLDDHRPERSSVSLKSKGSGALMGLNGSRGGAVVGLRLNVAAAIAVLLALMIAAAMATAQGDSLGYAVKAAYLYKFTPFVDWPSSAFPAPASPFYICVLGADPFGAMLDDALKGRQVGEHPVKTLRLQTLDSPDACHILYLGALPAQPATAALNRVRGTPVLTVTEQGQGVSGGVVQFVIRDGRVRFTIDSAAAAANRMAISAKLLSLAAAQKAGP